jgi:hypothetical protein
MPLGFSSFTEYVRRTGVAVDRPYTPLERAILSPVGRSWQMGCVQRSSNARAYKQAVVVAGELTLEKRKEIRDYVLDKLKDAQDQSDPMMPSRCIHVHACNVLHDSI